MTTATNAISETAALQMIRAEINVREFQRWMGTRRLQDPDHAMHCLLTECFGKPAPDGLAPRPFRVILPRGGSRGCLYGYARTNADELRDAAAIYACPLQSRIIPAAGLDSKPMPAQWQAGKSLGFEVRIRPIVRRSRNDDARPGSECDAFQVEAEQRPKGGMERNREKVYRDWLAERLQHRGGARLNLEQTKLVSFQRTRAIRKLHARVSEGPDAIMRGTLTVTDSAAFANLLAQGIGRHRAYGYGMLLLRPPGRTMLPMRHANHADT